MITRRKQRLREGDWWAATVGFISLFQIPTTVKMPVFKSAHNLGRLTLHNPRCLMLKSYLPTPSSPYLCLAKSFA